MIGLGYTSKISSEAESSEVGSDEERVSLPVSDEIPLDLNDPPMDGEWRSFGEKNSSGGRNAEGMPCLDTVGSDIVLEEYPGAAIIIGKGHNLYSRIIAADEHHEKRKIAGPFYPFADKEEWETYKWLSSLRVPMEKIDEYFKLPSVSYSLLSSMAFCSFPAGETPPIVFFFFKGNESTRRTSSCHSSLEASRDQGSRSNYEGAADAVLSRRARVFQTSFWESSFFGLYGLHTTA